MLIVEFFQYAWLYRGAGVREAAERGRQLTPIGGFLWLLFGYIGGEAKFYWQRTFKHT